MSVSLARLQALQRQAGGGRRKTGVAPAPLAAAASTAGQSDARPAAGTTGTAKADELARLRTLLRIRTPAAPPRKAASAFDRSLPGEEIAPGLRCIHTSLPADALPPRFDGAFDRRGDVDPAQLLFFDTETTGLAGGTGTRAFMIGAAHWQDDHLLIRQLLITSLSAEAAMLAEFARWLRPDTVLASYNGKSYDAPLLRTRYRLARQPDPLAGLAHIDLLYPSRRRWRGVYENCRLATIERHALGIVREDDLPGSQAPAAWLGYLRGGPARNLRRVTQHNHQDVVTLSRLIGVLSGAEDGRG